ncbi:hypothetical protein EV193_11825 [Herbihabitans rhizosphaerae]|uniref:Uncharacterized protein n=1 Tax=Herbihabitans rhizosphaerae TaxID=1872711 RepID=A0A4V2ERA5_9PSEU|nr:hypothetical protein [Herbihabitans rhizosphaerae]RZS29771.1 hypothetical protein EV193_11825 [Herbihabitans rhizosphaerae]
MPPPACVLADLAERLSTEGPTLPRQWGLAGKHFREWADQPDLREKLRAFLIGLSPEISTALISRSRETTTHYAWCLRDRSSEPFSFWLHQYKPQHDWRRGYADSVHNHRYHFCTTLLRGGYTHERYRAAIDPETRLISSVELIRSANCTTGNSGHLWCHEFHRIPHAEDGTLTFLVKSRAMRESSLSFDPATRASQRHVPVESRLDTLASAL